MNDGLIIVNKPAGVTSHDVVNKIRKIFKTKQVGHLGTLDPNATGVLVVCLNEATKLVPYLENDDKTYICEVIIGIRSDTYDITGTILESKDVMNIEEIKIDNVLESFLGISEQIPPIYSAIKINGKKLYEYARKNETIDIPSRTIEIKEIKRISPITYYDNKASFLIIANVSKGTYLRSLCFDIGQKLGLPALMGNLMRTRSGSFLLDKANSIEEIEQGKYELIPIIEALNYLPMIDDESLNNKAYHGMKIKLNDIKSIINDLPPKIIFKHNEQIIAIYYLDDELHCYKAARVWN